MVEDSYEKQKKAILSRRRRVIYNNDGGDATQNAKGVETAEDFLQLRTTPILDSNVDTISYCTSRGFGVFNIPYTKKDKLNHGVIPALEEKGIDPLQLMVERCHQHDIEVFWSMRMNDTHDATRPAMLSANRFKEKNPECLMGTRDERPKIGGWSAVNYACDKVREALLGFVHEVCRDYDIDGVELDFFRHPVFFERTTQGLPVSDDDRETMTDLMRSVAKLVEAEGRRRGRPFMVAVRTPDDVDYCNTMGLQIERWMEDRLIDIYIPTGYIKLNNWEYSVRTGHNYGVKVYPGLSESRVGGGHHADPLRSSDECYRARALNAHSAGADGVYLFNLFDPNREIWHELGDPAVMQRRDRVYFASVRGVGSVAGGAYPHEHFINVSTVNPDSPMPMAPGSRNTIKIEIGECPADNIVGQPPEITLRLQVRPQLEDTADVTVVFNGFELEAILDQA